jgi:hypothetical protein
MSESNGKNHIPTSLEKGIAELQELHELLLSGDVDPRILTDFRDALNRVRNAAWAAQQYVARKDSDQGPTPVLSLLALERIRAAYQLCRLLSEDLDRADIDFPSGSLVQLHEVTKTLTEQLGSVIKKLG